MELFPFFCFYFVGSFTLRNEIERMKDRDQEIKRGWWGSQKGDVRGVENE